VNPYAAPDNSFCQILVARNVMKHAAKQRKVRAASKSFVYYGERVVIFERWKSRLRQSNQVCAEPAAYVSSVTAKRKALP